MRTRKAILNSCTALIYQLVSLISGLIVPRLVLQYYGSEINGVMSSAVQFMSAIGLLNVGITGAARAILYKSLANNDTSKTNSIMNAITHYMNKVALVLAVYICVLSVIFPLIAETEVPRATVAGLVLSIGINKFFEQFLGQPYRILLQADQKHYVENILTTICCIVYTIVSVYMIKNIFTIISVKLISAVISLGTMIGVYIFVKRNYKLLRLKKYDKQILSQRTDAAVHSIANIIHQNSDLVILTLFVNIKVVSVYTVYYYAVGQIKNLLNSFTAGLEAGLGNVCAKKEYKTLDRTFRIYEWFTSCFIIVIFSCVVCLLLPFVSLYTAGITDVEYIRPGFAILIVIAESIYCIRTPYVSMVYAAGRYKETRNVSIAEAFTNVVVSISLVCFMGLNGVIIGTICANLIRTSYYMYYCSNELLQRSLNVIVRNICWTLATAAFVIVIQKFFMGFFLNIETWYQWLFSGIMCVVVAFVITILSSLIFYKKQLIYFANILKGMLIRK